MRERPCFCICVYSTDERVCVCVCVTEYSMCVRERQRLRATFSAFCILCQTHCVPGATNVIYQTGAPAWKYSFLSSDRGALCVSAEKCASLPPHAFEGGPRRMWEEV